MVSMNSSLIEFLENTYHHILHIVIAIYHDDLLVLKWSRSIKKSEMCIVIHSYYQRAYVSHLGRRMTKTNQPDPLTVTRINVDVSSALNIWLESEATADKKWLVSSHKASAINLGRLEWFRPRHIVKFISLLSFLKLKTH